MSSPTIHADETLKALSRYLAGHPRVLWRYPRQEEKTQHGVNMCVQHVVDTVEVEKRIIQEKINQETKRIEVPPLQFMDKSVGHPCRGAETGPHEPRGSEDHRDSTVGTH